MVQNKMCGADNQAIEKRALDPADDEGAISCANEKMQLYA
jgi:hypothetical protein